MIISAFPVLERGGSGLELTDPGMTLRDYFAAHERLGRPVAIRSFGPSYKDKIFD